MALSTQPYKGARDFFPEDKRRQNWLFRKLRESVEAFGYEEYDAPILEPIDIYLVKSGSEIVDEQTYTFADRAGRQVAIRPEMTPTVSRMVAARRQELAYPLRWYSIPNLWRYERPQKGRLREHWQLNVDIFGVAGVEAEHEMIQVVQRIMKSLGARESMYSVKINHRQLINFVLSDYLGLDEVQAYSMSKLIDRMHKMEYGEFQAQVEAICNSTQRENGAVAKLEEFLKCKKLANLPEAIKSHESAKQLVKLFELLESSGLSNVEFDPGVMRGFDYYTGVVFEVFDKHPDNNRSLFGGGRYDGLVGLFGVEPVPTVGFGMGDVTLANFVELHELLPDIKPETDLYVATVGDDMLEKVQRPVKDLRGMGINVALDISGKKLGDQIRSADKKGINYVMVVGQKELDDENYTLKNLKDGSEEKHGLERIVSIVKDHRSI